MPRRVRAAAWAPTRRLGAALVLLVLIASGAAAQLVNRPPLIGFLPLGSASNADDRSYVEAFRKGLREAGLVEHRDLVLEIVWTTEDDVVPAVGRLMQRGAKFLIPVGTSASIAVKREAPTVPTLFISVGNPLGIGLVPSLSRPGANVTGFSDVLAELGAKYVQFALEVGSPPSAVHYLWYAGWTDGYRRLQISEQAADALKARLRARAIYDIAEVDEALASMKRAGAAIVIVQPSPFTFRERDRILAAATSHGLATIQAFSAAAPSGALLTYGPDYADLYRRAASYLQRILGGTKPGDLPVQQPTKFELLVNLKTAKATGITVPRSLLLSADRVIE